MKLVRFKNIPVVINLDWVALPADQSERSATKAALEQSKGNKPKAGVVVKYGGVTLLGLGPPGAKVINGPSAAAWLSMANQKAIDQPVTQSAGMPSTGSGSSNDWIVVENLGDGNYWLVIIRDGVPLPGTDVTFNRETTLDLVREAVETAPFIVYSTDEGIRDDAPSGTIVDNKGFAELVKGTKPGKAAMRTISGVSVKFLAALGGFMLLVLLWFGYSFYAKQKQLEELRIASAREVAEQNKMMAKDKSMYASQAAQAVINALETGERDLNTALASPSPDDAIRAWVEMVKSVSINQNGWNLTSISCSSEKDGTPTCKVNLNRNEFGINRILMEDHPDAVIVGDTASFVLRGPVPVRRDTNFRGLVRSDAFSSSFVSDLQMLHLAEVKYMIGDSTDVVAAVTMPPVPASIFKPGSNDPVPAPGPVKMGVASGALTFTGDAMWQAEGLREFLRHSNIEAKSLDVAVADMEIGSWSLIAAYYIKNAPEPILPVVVGVDKEVLPVQLPTRFRASPEDLANWTATTQVAAGQSPAAPGPKGAPPSAGVAPETPPAPGTVPVNPAPPKG